MILHFSIAIFTQFAAVEFALERLESDLYEILEVYLFSTEKLSLNSLSLLYYPLSSGLQFCKLPIAPLILQESSDEVTHSLVSFFNN